jgi:hypothetical protein
MKSTPNLIEAKKVIQQYHDVEKYIDEYYDYFVNDGDFYDNSIESQIFWLECDNIVKDHNRIYFLKRNLIYIREWVLNKYKYWKFFVTLKLCFFRLKLKNTLNNEDLPF